MPQFGDREVKQVMLFANVCTQEECTPSFVRPSLLASTDFLSPVLLSFLSSLV